MQEIDIISKGEYAFLQSDPLLQTESYVIFMEQGKKYLLLKWHNLRKETLTGLDFTVEFYDARGTRTGERRFPVGKLQKAGQTSFVLDVKIGMPADCVDFRVQINRARYGNFAYVPHEDGVTMEYDVAPRRIPGVPVSGKENKTPEITEVRVRRPIYPIWVSLVTFLLLCCVMVFMAWQAATFGEDKNSFLRNGVRYSFADGNKSEGSELVVSGYWGRPVNVTIEAEIDGHPVTSVNNDAFSGCDTLKSVTFKGTVTIKTDAFENCSKLQSVNFENVTKIGEQAFRYCQNLKEVVSDRLTYIGDYAFNYCRSLERVELSAIEFLGRCSFHECDELATIQLVNADVPLDVSENVFAYCDNLETVIIDQEIVFLDDFASLFFQCSTKDMKIKSLDGESTINKLFQNCQITGELEVGSMPQIPERFCNGMNLSKLTIGHLDDPVIGDNAFNGCSQLTELDIPSVREVGASAFGFTRISFFDASELERIGNAAFQYCEQLAEFDLTENTVLREIGENAWFYCTSLTEIHIPDCTETIGKSILGSSGVQICTLPYLGDNLSSPQKLDYFFGLETNLVEEVSVRSGTTLVDGAFNRFSEIKRIHLPDTLQTVGDNAFSECYNLEEVQIPEGVMSIGDNAFYGCDKLTEITLPASLQEVGFEIFQACDRLYEIFNNSSLDMSDSGAKNVLKIYNNGEESVPKASLLGYTFGYFGSQWILIGYPQGETILTLPDFFVYDSKIEEYRVADNLFYRDSLLTQVTIPAAVSALGENAFSECYVLEKVEFTGSVLTVLPDYVFSNCSALAEITIPQGITEIREGAFYQSGLQKVVLPKTLRSIGELAFAGCTELRTVYNLSGLTLAKGSSGYGGVAQYAENIYTSLEQGENLSTVKKESMV